MDELREIHRIRQREGEPRRRWFTGHDLDVFTWQGVDGELVGFQVTYDNPAREKAISWKAGEAISFSNVLTGGPISGGHPGTPLLTASQDNDAWSLCGELLRRVGGLDDGLLQGICRVLTSQQGNLTPGSDVPACE